MFPIQQAGSRTFDRDYEAYSFNWGCGRQQQHVSSLREQKSWPERPMWEPCSVPQRLQRRAQLNSASLQLIVGVHPVAGGMHGTSMPGSGCMLVCM
mmetsp:Transcript_89755/g.178446  ORF Transcript_89755/g.178446 Transcript_89755/m.178446 type:complete len:96 (-) Transcript_89755:185-472(-)